MYHEQDKVKLFKKGYLTKVVDFEMNGVNPELASDYLNALADWVTNKIELDIQESIQKGVEAQRCLCSLSKLNSPGLLLNT